MTIIRPFLIITFILPYFSIGNAATSNMYPTITPPGGPSFTLLPSYAPSAPDAPSAEDIIRDDNKRLTNRLSHAIASHKNCDKEKEHLKAHIKNLQDEITAQRKKMSAAGSNSVAWETRAKDLEQQLERLKKEYAARAHAAAPAPLTRDQQLAAQAINAQNFHNNLHMADTVIALTRHILSPLYKISEPWRLRLQVATLQQKNKEREENMKTTTIGQYQLKNEKLRKERNIFIAGTLIASTAFGTLLLKPSLFKKAPL